MDRLASMETFVQVVETGSFSERPGSLVVGQPAVSKSVALLEEMPRGQAADALDAWPHANGGRARLSRACQARPRGSRRSRARRARSRRRTERQIARLCRGDLRADPSHSAAAEIPGAESGAGPGGRSGRPSDRPRPGGHRCGSPDGKDDGLDTDCSPYCKMQAPRIGHACLFRSRGHAVDAK